MISLGLPHHRCLFFLFFFLFFFFSFFYFFGFWFLVSGFWFSFLGFEYPAKCYLLYYRMCRRSEEDPRTHSLPSPLPVKQGKKRVGEQARGSYIHTYIHTYCVVVVGPILGNFRVCVPRGCWNGGDARRVWRRRRRRGRRRRRRRKRRKEKKKKKKKRTFVIVRVLVQELSGGGGGNEWLKEEEVGG